MANEVVQAKGTALSADVISDLMQDSGEGTVFNSDEMQIPYIRLAQAMSPQVTKGDGKFIKGLAAGDIFNNLTNEYWDGETGLKVIPCYLVTKYIEWIPMEKGVVLYKRYHQEILLLERSLENKTLSEMFYLMVMRWS